MAHPPNPQPPPPTPVSDIVTFHLTLNLVSDISAVFITG